MSWDPRAVASDLKPLIGGELLFDEVGRMLYASSACLWEIPPLGVVVARDADDVAATVAYAAEHGIAIIPRGAATGLAGQAIGRGIVIDVSKYLKGCEPLGDGRYRVEPGVVLKAFEAQLNAVGRTFPPDPSSGRMCTVGGMIANNAAGAHSVKYGFTADYVDTLEVVLADGSRQRLGPQPHPTSGLAARVDAVLRPAQPLLAEHWPRTNKSSSGYRLPQTWSEERVDLAELICGSEGTLAFVVEAVLRTRPMPAATALAMVAVDRLDEVGDIVNEVLAWRPSAAEILDRTLLDLLREHEAPALELVPGDPDTLLFVEFDGADEAEVEAALAPLRAAYADRPGVRAVLATSAADQKQLWGVRHASSPILNRMPGRLKPLTFIEDGVVEPARLPEYIRGLGEIFARHGVNASMFGHAGNGHIHVKPILNLRTQADVEKMEAIAGDTCDLLASLRGALAGEHGDGLARTPLLPRLYGPVYPLFEQIKAIFDPAGTMNPGKIVEAEPRRVTDDLRFNDQTPVVSTGTVFDQEHWLLEMDKCHGCGTCRDYCPVFIATGDEAASARAKANLLRAVMRGALPTGALYEPSFKAVMDLCVNCQLCLTECPTQVDIPGLARRARAEYVRHHGQTVQNRLLADSGRTSALNAAVAPLANVVLASDLARTLMEKTVGIDRRRRMPTFARQPFGSYRSPGWSAAARRVIYFPGCYAVYNDPEGEARAVIEVLEANDVAVHVPAKLRCCGIAKLTVGSEDSARDDARENLRLLRGLVGPETPLVASAASCGLALKVDYPELLDGVADSFSSHVHDIHEYLLALHAAGELDLDLPPVERTIAYHEPCHLKSQPTAAGSALRLLRLIPGLTVVPTEDSCCGIAGTFGMKAQNFELSMKMGAPLFAELERAAPELVATGCGTCQIQVTQGTGLAVAHPVRLLAEAYRAR